MSSNKLLDPLATTAGTTKVSETDGVQQDTNRLLKPSSSRVAATTVQPKVRARKAETLEQDDSDSSESGESSEEESSEEAYPYSSSDDNRSEKMAFKRREPENDEMRFIGRTKLMIKLDDMPDDDDASDDAPENSFEDGSDEEDEEDWDAEQEEEDSSDPESTPAKPGEEDLPE